MCDVVFFWQYRVSRRGSVSSRSWPLASWVPTAAEDPATTAPAGELVLRRGRGFTVFTYLKGNRFKMLTHRNTHMHELRCQKSDPLITVWWTHTYEGLAGTQCWGQLQPWGTVCPYTAAVTHHHLFCVTSQWHNRAQSRVQPAWPLSHTRGLHTHWITPSGMTGWTETVL